jgi:hypothetical protein
MGEYGEAFVAFDVAKRKHAVAIAEGGRTGEVRFAGEVENSPAAIERTIKKLGKRYDRLHVCFKAGPTGYGLCRQVRDLGGRHGRRRTSDRGFTHPRINGPQGECWGLYVEKAGIEYDAGIKTDARLRTSNKRSYAIGDIAGGPQPTHVARPIAARRGRGSAKETSCFSYTPMRAFPQPLVTQSSSIGRSRGNRRHLPRAIPARFLVHPFARARQRYPASDHPPPLRRFSDFHPHWRVSARGTRPELFVTSLCFCGCEDQVDRVRRDCQRPVRDTVAVGVLGGIDVVRSGSGRRVGGSGRCCAIPVWSGVTIAMLAILIKYAPTICPAIAHRAAVVLLEGAAQAARTQTWTGRLHQMLSHSDLLMLLEREPLTSLETSAGMMDGLSRHHPDPANRPRLSELDHARRYSARENRRGVLPRYVCAVGG